MNILVNSLPLTGILTGIARYVRNLYRSLESLQAVGTGFFNGRTAVQNMPLQNGGGSWLIKNGKLRFLPDPALFAMRCIHWLGYEHRLRSVVRKQSYDIYHETGFVPARVPDLPVVYTLYDLSLRRFAHTHPRERVWFFEYFVKRRLPLTAHVLTISEYIRSEIMEEFRMPPEMVTAVPLAPDPHFFPRPGKQVRRVLSRLDIPEDYLLFTGTLEPRKNIELLIKALPLLRQHIPLVLAGWSGWGDKSWRERLSRDGLDTRVIQTGYVDEEDLACLYSGAGVFIYPSLYEGFGLPVLEAMACGCPVIASRSSCLPETAGRAAKFTDPRDPEELAFHIGRLLEDSGLRRELIQLGLEHASGFSWTKTAAGTLEVFDRVLQQQGNT